jgi:hypothetical protein
VLPVYEGELPARALGADLHAFDDDVFVEMTRT